MEVSIAKYWLLFMYSFLLCLCLYQDLPSLDVIILAYCNYLVKYFIQYIYPMLYNIGIIVYIVLYLKSVRTEQFHFYDIYCNYCIISIIIVYITLYLIAKCNSYNKERIYTMAVATTIPRYSKTQKLLIGNEEITLIDHLKDLRTKRKITKKKISNIIKQNDYWYSQVERDGKNGDDNRQKTIYKTDLIDIISIVKFGAESFAELENFRIQSELYIDKEIHALPLSESIKKLEWYQVNNIRTPNEQDSFFSSLLDSISKILQETYSSLSIGDRNEYLNVLKEMNASMKIDPLFIVFLAGLPLSEFLYEAEQSNITTLISELTTTVDKFSIQNDSEQNRNNLYYLSRLREVLKKYISESAYMRRRNFEMLPDDEIDF